MRGQLVHDGDGFREGGAPDGALAARARPSRRRVSCSQQQTRVMVRMSGLTAAVKGHSSCLFGDCELNSLVGIKRPFLVHMNTMFQAFFECVILTREMELRGVRHDVVGAVGTVVRRVVVGALARGAGGARLGGQRAGRRRSAPRRVLRVPPRRRRVARCVAQRRRRTARRARAAGLQRERHVRSRTSRNDDWKKDVKFPSFCRAPALNEMCH